MRQAHPLRVAWGRAVIVGLAIALAISANACKKKPGGPLAGEACTTGKSACLSEKAALLCGEADTFVEVPCRGKNGCKVSGAIAMCDRSVAEKGDACAAGEDPKERGFCSVDGQTAMVCRAGKLLPSFACKKPDCHVEGRRAECSRATAEEGAPCAAEGDTYCAEDETSVLRCKSGLLETYRACRGKEGCRGGQKPTCDETLAKPGDVCILPGLVVCSEDGESELVCQNGRFAVSRACKKSGCKVTNVAQKRIDCR